MNRDRLAHAVLDRVARIEGFVGILENDLRLAAEFQQRRTIGAVEAADAVEMKFSPGRFC